MKLSVIIPVYNERSTIEEVIRRVASVPLEIEREIIVADDGSRDGTAEVLRRVATEHVIKVHTCLINLGKGAAVRFGLEYASGDIILIQDADLELNPEEYPRLIEPILRGRAQVVYGSRFRQPNPGVAVKTRVANHVLVWLTNLLYGSRLTDMESAYKVFHREAISRIRLRAVGFEFEPEITAKLLRLGYHIAETPVSYRPRTSAEGKKIGWRDGVKAILCLVRYRLGPRERFLR
jgi:glycosyltransferase involved in cell wall biosynthesis